MNKKDKVEMTRSILNNAMNMNLNKEIILKISQKLDQCIYEYYEEHDKREKA